MKRLLLLFSLLIGLSACGEKEMAGVAFDININELSAPKELFDEYKYIILERTEQSVVGNIDQLRLNNTNITILDKRQHSIFIFDRNGKFISKLHRMGRGHGEYIEISDFNLYNSHLYVLDRSSKKLNKYTTNGNFVENYNLDDFYSHFYIIDDKLAFMSSECANKSGKNFTLYNYIDNTVVESFDNFPDVEFYLSTITPFNPTNSGQMLITKDFDNSVYLLNDNSLDAIFSFNFNTKVNFEEKEKGVPSIQTLDRLQNQELVQRIEIIYTTDDFIFITFPIFYSDLGKRWHIAKINRKDKQVKLVRIADEIDHVVPFLSFPPLAIYDDWVVMAVPPVLVLERDSNFAKILSEYDNPVLFFNKLSK